MESFSCVVCPEATNVLMSTSTVLATSRENVPTSMPGVPGQFSFCHSLGGNKFGTAIKDSISKWFHLCMQIYQPLASTLTCRHREMLSPGLHLIPAERLQTRELVGCCPLIRGFSPMSSQDLVQRLLYNGLPCTTITERVIRWLLL